MKQVSHLKASLIGAACGLAATVVQRTQGTLPPRPITYWAGAAMGGALLGVLVAWLINRRKKT